MSLHQAMQGMRTSDMPWLQAAAPTLRQHTAHPHSMQPGQQLGFYQSAARAPGSGTARSAAAGGDGAHGRSSVVTGNGHAVVHGQAAVPGAGGGGGSHRGCSDGTHGQGPTGKEPPVPRSLHHARQRWLAQWVWWVMAKLVVPLLRGCFHCTESEPYRQQVFYYRWVRGQVQST